VEDSKPGSAATELADLGQDDWQPFGWRPESRSVAAPSLRRGVLVSIAESTCSVAERQNNSLVASAQVLAACSSGCHTPLAVLRKVGAGPDAHLRANICCYCHTWPAVAGGEAAGTAQQEASWRRHPEWPSLLELVQLEPSACSMPQLAVVVGSLGPVIGSKSWT